MIHEKRTKDAFVYVGAKAKQCRKKGSEDNDNN
jgi:hypothetical protein